MSKKTIVIQPTKYTNYLANLKALGIDISANNWYYSCQFSRLMAKEPSPDPACTKAFALS